MGELSTGSRVVAALAILQACSAGPPEPVVWDWQVDAAIESRAVFAGHAELLDGFVAHRPGRDLAAGDRVLLGFHVVDGEQTTTRFVDLAVLDPGGEAEAEATVRATVFDGERRRLGAAEFGVLRDSLLGELHATCARFADGTGAVASARGRDAWLGAPARGSKGAGMFVLAELVRVLKQTALLRDLLWDCVSRPGLFTLMTSGASVSFGAEFERSERIAPPFEDRPGYRFPFLIRVAGDPALECTVIATDNLPPLTLCAGVLAVHGRNLEPSPNSVLVQVLAAHQAAGAAQTSKLGVSGLPGSVSGRGTRL